MTDRELIEAAAEAGGMPPWTWDEEAGCLNCQFRSDLTNMHFWNPLIDDGDALRLAVKLKMEVGTPGPNGAAIVRPIGGHDVRERAAGDPYAATRRAIVIAAAAPKTMRLEDTPHD